MDVKEIVALLTALLGTIGTVMTVIVTKYLSKRDKQIAAQQAFRSVVDSLSSNVEPQRVGGAILLRRFFDPQTEFGGGGTPYAGEAVSVIAAILRETETSNFQKLLADGLQYAPSLEGVDLQRTNLQNAYLGRKRGAARGLLFGRLQLRTEERDRIPDLRRADFFRADLSAASLKGANCSGAFFYQTRLHNTIFKGTDLTGAEFYEADLLGADFSGAMLTDAKFIRPRNVPPKLSERFRREPTVHVEPQTTGTESPAAGNSRPRVFISKPGTLSVPQGELLRSVTAVFAEEDIEIATVERGEYPNVGAVSEVRRVLGGCRGAVILGFRQLEISKGSWRSGTREAKDVENVALPTSWNHVEAGMAAMAGLPMLFLVEQGMVPETFELGDVGYVVSTLDLLKPNHDAMRQSIRNWCHSVREADARVRA